MPIPSNHEEILEFLNQRGEHPWLVNYNSHRFYELTLAYLEIFSSLAPASHILLLETNPWEFLAAFLAGVISQKGIFLGTTQWGEHEWQEVLSMVEPDLIIGKEAKYLSQKNKSNLNYLPSSLIMIPTGGSSGKIRFAMHTWSSLLASVQGLQTYFQVDNINSFCTLPLYHVSGLMQFVRSFVSQGYFYLLPSKTLKVSPPFQDNFSDYFISLVPTQLHFLLATYSQWLGQFFTVFLGGAPLEFSLSQRARELGINLAPSYGMTETASQIVTLKPQDFCQGNNSSGQVLPHAQIKINEQEIIISSASLCLGYYPQIFPNSQEFSAGDLGYFDREGYLYILGRKSQVIISGGEKVFPQEVESVLLETGLLDDVVIMGLGDPYWGEVIVAVYVPKSSRVSLLEIQTSVRSKLANFKQPKHWLEVEKIPRSEQGKVQYQKLLKMISK